LSVSEAQRASVYFWSCPTRLVLCYSVCANYMES